ncbi:MAG: ATP-binding cassette domain-containing protein [Prolixibacteraceae bacterium]|jgi:molybdate transport system ATP-binding protein|nr:ATP-binding cassette domain-containing protein [Prolixibacteraceae bacterium]
MSTERDLFIVQAQNLDFHPGMFSILEHISFRLKKGESLALTGSSGSGKTSLGKILSGLIAPTRGELTVAPGIKRLMVDQQDHFISQSGRTSPYYSQRYERIEEDHSPDVRTYLKNIRKKAGYPDDDQQISDMMEQMQIISISERKLIQLSNGERKRIQLTAALLQKPGLLVLDQPFTGLDAEARANLNEILFRQMNSGISLVIICDQEHIPRGIHKVLELHKGKLVRFAPSAEYIPQSAPDEPTAEADAALFDLLPAPKEACSDIVRMRNVNVSFGGKEILKNINWQVKNGEQWALLGPNGAGKTTLLSLITADNPQGYSNDLVLFDRKRGSGESIWDIKKRIGFVSPELHLYFLRGGGIRNSVPGLGEKPHASYDTLSCADVIVSGFRDEVGFAASPTGLQRKIATAWLSIMKLEHLHDRKFYQASLGEQRLLLLARALVKSPSLLILDEPCQGLDPKQTKHFIHLLEVVCKNLNTTMIYVTHLKEEIPSCVDKLLQLENGRINYYGEFHK